MGYAMVAIASAVATIVPFADSAPSVEGWQPTINTVLLIVLAVVGQRHVKTRRNENRTVKRRLRKIELTVGDIEKTLDNADGIETNHLH